MENGRRAILTAALRASVAATGLSGAGAPRAAGAAPSSGDEVLRLSHRWLARDLRGPPAGIERDLPWPKNEVLARLLDTGFPLSAEISRTERINGWLKIDLQV